MKYNTELILELKEQYINDNVIKESIDDVLYYPTSKYLTSINYAKIVDYFTNNISPESKILELAGGIGNICYNLKLNGFLNITMNENNMPRLECTRELGKILNLNINTIGGYFQNINFKNYDYIFATDVGSGHAGNLEDLPLFEDALNSGTKFLFVEHWFGLKSSSVCNDYSNYQSMIDSKKFMNYLKNNYNYKYVIDEPVAITEYEADIQAGQNKGKFIMIYKAIV